MKSIGFEVSVNGEHIYTVGIDDWRIITAEVRGSHFPADKIPSNSWPPDQAFPEEGLRNIHFGAHVAVDKDPPGLRGSLDSLSYERKSISVGDTVTIKVVLTDSPDEPNAPKADPNRPGAVLVSTNSGKAD